MPTACTLDALEITAARPGDPRSNYFATPAIGFARMLTEDEMVTQLFPSLEDEDWIDKSRLHLQANLVPMPIDKKGSTLEGVLNHGRTDRMINCKHCLDEELFERKYQMRNFCFD